MVKDNSNYLKYRKYNLRYARDYYKNNIEKMRKYAIFRRKINWNINEFNGQRDLVLERDNYTCQYCGMTQEQHILLFNKSLTIHHLDGKGVNVPRTEKNNDINNLITLCLRCHGREDSLRRWKK